MPVLRDNERATPPERSPISHRIVLSPALFLLICGIAIPAFRAVALSGPGGNWSFSAGVDKSARLPGGLKVYRIGIGSEGAHGVLVTTYDLQASGWHFSVSHRSVE